MAQWVYMEKDGSGRLIIGMTLEPDLPAKMSRAGKDIVYLRKFSHPMDAAAHKHLLDDLSRETPEWLIRKYKRKTKSV